MPQAHWPWLSRHGCDLIVFHHATEHGIYLLKLRGLKLFDRRFTCVIVWCMTQNDITVFPGSVSLTIAAGLLMVVIPHSWTCIIYMFIQPLFLNERNLLKYTVCIASPRQYQQTSWLLSDACHTPAGNLPNRIHTIKG